MALVEECDASLLHDYDVVEEYVNGEDPLARNYRPKSKPVAAIAVGAHAAVAATASATMPSHAGSSAAGSAAASASSEVGSASPRSDSLTSNAVVVPASRVQEFATVAWGGLSLVLFLLTFFQPV